MDRVKDVRNPVRNLALVLLALFCTQSVAALGFTNGDGARSGAKVRQGRLPVVIIPGLTGSELVNEKTGKTVWFSVGRAEDDDLRLPISPEIAANRDDLAAGDILRSVKISSLLPKFQIYENLIKSLEKDGYVEGRIDDPTAGGFQDTFYVFPYDWRRDNVENAILLLEKLDKVRARVKRPNLRFNVVAHSMGGLIARYAAMYGKNDLSDHMKGPAGDRAAYFNNISLIGTPNGGSVMMLEALLNGLSLTGGWRMNLPFVRDLTKFDLFTIPSAYQLLPHDGLLRVFDEDLKKIDVDVYSLETWKKYGWPAYEDKGFKDEFSAGEQILAEKYLRTVLHRAKLFQSALNAKPNPDRSVRVYNFGAECRPTMDGMIVYKETKTDTWKTIFEARPFKKSNGSTVPKKSVEAMLNAPGDGQVSKDSLNHSFEDATYPGGGVKALTLDCGYHAFLVKQKLILKSVLSVLAMPQNAREK